MLRRFSLAVALLSAVWLMAAFATTRVSAADSAADVAACRSASGGGEEDLAAVLLGHVMDSKDWDVLPGLPPVRLPRGVSTHALMLWIATVLMGGMCVWALRRRRLKVTGAANLLEILVLFVRDDIVYPVMGAKRGEKWLPFFTTLFLFLLAVNYLGMIPAFRTATGNFNVTTALALMILVLIFGAGVARLGAPRFFRNMYPGGAPVPIGIFVWCIELAGTFVKALVLSLRLFANMFAGHMIILSLLSMIFVLSPWFCSISLPLAVFVYALEMLVALIQALVFTLLSCIFISMASTPHEE